MKLNRLMKLNRFMEFKKLEQKAKEIRGDGPVLGKNILAVGFETSFPGSYRPSTIRGSDMTSQNQERKSEIASTVGLTKMPKLSVAQAMDAWGGQFVNGVSAPMSELESRMTKVSTTDMNSVKEDPSSVTNVSGTFSPSQFKKRKGKVMNKKKRGRIMNRRNR